MKGYCAAGVVQTESGVSPGSVARANSVLPPRWRCHVRQVSDIFECRTDREAIRAWVWSFIEK
jgi:hypothetical protein